MAGKFEYRPFSQIDLSDPFFDSLKQDYEEFATSWFPKCVKENRDALVFSDEHGLGAFVAMKEECEPIQLQTGSLPALPRLKISTLRLAERFRGQRLGEGALGLVLWKWQALKLQEIYVTVYETHDDLISQLYKFGFLLAGRNPRGELVYIRSRSKIDFTDPYKSFPFVSPYFSKGGYLIVDDQFHDTLFPYSELQYAFQEQLDRDAANGVSKVYIGKQPQMHYRRGEPVFIYRRFTGVGTKRYRSCITSYCVVDDVIAIKRNGQHLKTFDEFRQIVGNKSVFSLSDLQTKYRDDYNVTVVRLLYCGYFGAGNNVNYDWLDKSNLWNPHGGYPTHTQLTPQQCALIWMRGSLDVDNVLGR